MFPCFDVLAEYIEHDSRRMEWIAEVVLKNSRIWVSNCESHSFDWWTWIMWAWRDFVDDDHHLCRKHFYKVYQTSSVVLRFFLPWPLAFSWFLKCERVQWFLKEYLLRWIFSWTGKPSSLPFQTRWPRISRSKLTNSSKNAVCWVR